LISVLLMNPDHVQRASNRSVGASKPENQCSATMHTEELPKVVAEFRPLDPSVVSAVARDVEGGTGGFFLFENSAVSFARRNSRPTGCATNFFIERFELDLKNRGNQLIGHLGHLKRPTIRHPQRMIAFIDMMMKAVRCRLKGFPFLDAIAEGQLGTNGSF
jgi:hypothetical protein